MSPTGEKLAGEPRATAGSALFWALHAVLPLAAVLAFFGVLAAGPGGRTAPALLAPATPPPDTSLAHVLLALLAIVVISRLFGRLMRPLRQPPVIGEVLAGLALGPSLLGAVSPDAQRALFPPAVVPQLGVLANVGVILFMFLVGLEFDLGLVRRQARRTFAVGQASIVLPFTLGAVLALWLYRAHAGASVSFPGFALFCGVAVSVTAFPVLARLLADAGLTRTRVGVTALAAAALGDATAWCLLALVVGVLGAQVERAAWTLGLAGAYALLMLAVVRPLAGRALARLEHGEDVDRRTMAAAFVALLASTLATEWIGLHALFGAFTLGAIIPRDSTLARAIERRVEDLVSVVFLPAFFAFTGLRTSLGLISGTEAWLACAVIVAVASAGKFGGAFLAARATGLPGREAAAVGVLMNTRGLVELVVLNVGLDLGVLSPGLFAMFVVMALVTTFATAPLVHLLGQRGAFPAAAD